MFIILGFYIFIGAVILILAVVSLKLWDKRYSKNHGLDIPSGFEKTEEISIDPISGKRFRVYYNSNTGERFYHEEDRNN